MPSANNVYWVTGASSGLGRAVALHLARQGHNVAITARSADALHELARTYPLQMIACPGDITNPEDIQRIIDKLAKSGLSVTCAILNAGTYSPDDAAHFKAVDFAAVQNINLNGTANCLAAVLPAMIAARAGHIVIVSSVAGYRGLPRSIAYSASKAGLIAMAEALAFDLIPQGIKIQIVCPGFIKTPLTDKNDFAMPCLMPVEDAAAAMIDGMAGPDFEIHFPRRFTMMMKLTALLPWRLYYRLVRRITHRKAS